MFQTVNSMRLNMQSLKHQRFSPPSFKNRGIRKLEFAASVQILIKNIFSRLCLHNFFHVFFSKFRSNNYKQKIDVLSKMFLFMGINWIAEVKLFEIILKAKYAVLIYTHS